MSTVIHMTDDIYRPSNSDGTPIEQSDSELYVTISGYSFRWYASCDITYNENSSSPSAKLECSNMLFGKMGNNSTKKNLRTIMQVSVSSDFSTHSDVTTVLSGGITTNGQLFYIFARKYPDSTGASTSLSGITKAPGSGDFHSYENTQNLNLSATNRQIWIRIKLQININGTWTDCVRPNASNRTWKTFTTYAPFYQNVTPPSNVYGNSVNRFTCSIPAKFISEFSTVKYNSSTNSLSGKVVRNDTLPYITTGTATSYLYLTPCLSVNQTQYSRYLFTMYLRIVDPSDSNFVITVSKREVSGDLQYLQSDDTSMFDNISWEIIDPDNIYSTYGAFLENIMSSVDIRISAIKTYGVDLSSNSFGYYYSAGFLKNISITSPETIVTVNIPNTDNYTHSVTVGIRAGWYNRWVIDDMQSIPIIPYHVPSFPNTSIHRCNEDGTANDVGAYCRIDWSVSITPINDLNHKKLVIKHPQGTATYDQLDSYTQNGSLIVAANTEYSYNIVFEVSDDFNTITKTLRLSTAHVTMDWLYNGQGVAFGKVANKENAVEIAEDWKLLAYEMWINDIDVGALLKKLFSRILTLEQFATQTGQTTQFSVSFYDDTGNTWLNRQWVRSGQDATDPRELSQSWQRIDTPTKEPTTNTTYSFVGWSKNKNATTNDSTALTNITANRNIYAAFSSAVRKYFVRWFNGTTLIETDDNLNYHAYATFESANPTKENNTFVGWYPSGQYITENTDANAIFYDETEISDSWEDIMKAVKNGTAKDKYNIGQYKELDCGEFGKTIVRIKGFQLNEYASSKKKVSVAWEGVDCLETPRRMNPMLEFETEDVWNTDAWTYTKNTFEGFHRFLSKYASLTYTSCTTTLTATVRCVTAGTLNLFYYITRDGSQDETYPVPENNLLTIKVNGTTIFSGVLSDNTRKTKSYTVSANSTYNIEVTFKATEPSIYADNVYIDIDPPNITTDTIEYTIPKYATSRISSYSDGTGCFGGWEKTELRAWLNGTFFSQIDPVVRDCIQSVKRHTMTSEYDGSAENSYRTVDKVSYDKISIPSTSEINGHNTSEPYGLDYWNRYKRIKYPHGISTGRYRYWTRSQSCFMNYDIQYSSDGMQTRIYNVPCGFVDQYPSSSSTTNNSARAENQEYVCICFDT